MDIQKKAFFDRFVTALLPMAFVGSGYLNVAAFALGLHRIDPLRKAFTFGIIGLTALLLLAKVLLLWRENAAYRKPMARAALIPVVFGLIYLWALVTQLDRGAIVKDAVVHGCYLVSACCALVIIVCERKLPALLAVSRVYAIVLSPLVLYYCVRFYLPDAAYGVANLGVMTYMDVAYTLLYFCVCVLLNGLLFRAGASQAACWADALVFLLFSSAITLSGTKGTIICMLVGSLLACAFAALAKKGLRSVLYFPVTAVLAAALFTTVLYPQYGVENRSVTFLKELSGENSVEVASSTIQEAADILCSVEQSQSGETPAQSSEMPAQSETQTPAAPQMEKVVDFVVSGKAEEALSAGQITQEQYDTLVDTSRKLNNTATGGRKYLWTCAFQEIKSAPLTGHGPLAYQSKYGTYPHNLFLELAADFGVPLTLAVLLLGVYVFICLIRLSFRNLYVCAFALYVFTYLFQKLVSGSLYDYSVFFQYGFCILIVFFFRNPRKKGVQADASQADAAPDHAVV